MPAWLNKSRLIKGSFIALTLLLAAGCAPKTHPAKFYQLQPLEQASRQDAGTSGVIGVGPVDIPAYLDRPQIVTGGSGSQLQIDEFQRWAEPLRDNATRVIAENLSALLPSIHVLAFPWNRTIIPDCQVEIQIGRLHVDGLGNAELLANWAILKRNKPLLMQTFHVKTPVEGNSYDAKVASQSQALAAFSRAIAKGLHNVMAWP
ncbi:MAG: membrane integrity-associated transporter subunit PqiC [Candidatus Methylumidiphilus sp.]